MILFYPGPLILKCTKNVIACRGVFVTFQLHFSSDSEVCLYAVLTFIFLGPDLTFYNYEIGPKSDPESRRKLLYPPLGVL